MLKGPVSPQGAKGQSLAWAVLPFAPCPSSGGITGHLFAARILRPWAARHSEREASHLAASEPLTSLPWVQVLPVLPALPVLPPALPAEQKAEGFADLRRPSQTFPPEKSEALSRAPLSAPSMHGVVAQLPLVQGILPFPGQGVIRIQQGVIGPSVPP